MRNKIILIIGILFTCYSNSQSGSWKYENDNKTIKIKYFFQLEEKDRDTTLTIRLTATNTEKQIICDFGKITLDNRNVLDSTLLASTVKIKYNEAFRNYGKDLILSSQHELEKMIIKVGDSLNDRGIFSFVFQGLNIFNSILTGAKRDSNNDGMVNFTVSKTYIARVNSFICSEDNRLVVSEFQNYLKDRKKIEPDNVGIDYLLAALDKQSGTINENDVISLLQIYFVNKLGRWPRGSDCGCCSNYPGPCAYWNAACLIHDMQCQSCRPRWYCLPGCVVSTCGGRTIWWAVNPV